MITIHFLTNELNTTYPCHSLQEVFSTIWITPHDRNRVIEWYHSNQQELYVAEYKLVSE